MNSTDRVLKEIESPEGQERLKKWAEKYRAKIDAKNDKKQEIFSNTDYIDWLIEFTQHYSNFSSDSWLYFPKEISKDDYTKVNNLNLMYEGIEEYASKNHLYPFPCNFGNFYKIKLENVGFEIGVLVGQGTLFFCNRVQIEEEKDFIDFNDIINNKIRSNATVFDSKLNELSNLVVDLFQSGVPIESITNTLDNTLNELKTKNDLNKQKVLKK